MIASEQDLIKKTDCDKCKDNMTAKLEEMARDIVDIKIDVASNKTVTQGIQESIKIIQSDLKTSQNITNQRTNDWLRYAVEVAIGLLLTYIALK